MGKKAISPEMAVRIYELREVLDEWGDHKWSCGAIAKQLGVSESTIWRVVAKRAAYVGRNAVMEKRQAEAQWKALEQEAFGQVEAPELDAAARASEEKMLRMLQGKEESWTEKQMSPETKARLALFRDVVPERPREAAKARVIPPSPLDGGEGGEDETQGVGMKALGERALANDKAREDNASALSGNNANELLKELS